MNSKIDPDKGKTQGRNIRDRRTRGRKIRGRNARGKKIIGSKTRGRKIRDREIRAGRTGARRSETVIPGPGRSGA